MAEYFARGHLRFVNGEWRNDDGDIVEISRAKHGNWIPKSFMVRTPYAKNYICSECGHEDRATRYCPNCGAKMDGGDDDG